MEKDMICICCPKGCHLHYKNNEISGYTCLRGKEYGLQEAIAPKRIVTSTFKVNSSTINVLSCKTSGPIPKEKIFLVMAEINKLNVDLPIKMNQVLIKNVLSLGVDIIATKECN